MLPLEKPAVRLSPRATYLVKLACWPKAAPAMRRASARRLAGNLTRCIFLSPCRRALEGERHAQQQRVRLIGTEERPVARRALVAGTVFELQVHEGEVGLPGSGIAITDAVAAAVRVRQQGIDDHLGLGCLVVDVAQAPLRGRAGLPAQPETVVVDIFPALRDDGAGQRVAGAAGEGDRHVLEAAPAGPVGVGLDQE